jgi:hypothetical protein
MKKLLIVVIEFSTALAGTLYTAVALSFPGSTTT